MAVRLIPRLYNVPGSEAHSQARNLGMRLVAVKVLASNVVEYSASSHNQGIVLLSYPP